MKELFANDYFLIFYGLIFYYVILWSRAKNKKSKALKARLSLCDSKAERSLVYDDEQYKFSFREWISDNKDEMIVAGMASLLLIGFDQLAADFIKQKYDFELGKAVFLLGGIGGDLLYRAYDKMAG